MFTPEGIERASETNQRANTGRTRNWHKEGPVGRGIAVVGSGPGLFFGNRPVGLLGPAAAACMPCQREPPPVSSSRIVGASKRERVGGWR